MKKIIVGFEGTDSSHKAADEAGELAAGLGAELHVITVVIDDPKKHGFDIEVVDERAVGAVEARSQGLRQRAAETAHQLDGAYPGVTVVTTILAGPPARSIVEHAEEIGADLIVVGNHRVQGLARLLGSVAIDILRDAPCSVYVAKTT